MTAPNARPTSGELGKQVGWELVIPWLPAPFRALLWSVTLLECVALFAATEYCPPGLAQSIVHQLVRSDDPQRTLTHISSLTPMFFAGSILSIIGSFLRIHCYNTLGRMFTYELSIRKDHKLITTGVYAIVRHPSYTGAVCSGFGLLLCILSPTLWFMTFQSLFPDPDVKTRMINVFWYTHISMFVGIVAAVMQRMKNEDAMLEKNFGEEWKEWARRVPCRLVPWVY
ncbi:hypothetical protein PAXINDRAFT_173248 [Paxillus involutus ATCC 200175]|uniref:Protein-S-isoprenylcysteine O-methyltransferase n=1 Tax=Paxillus involutus ATCC 200175 TaxID=664439 RepID=A0A0C9SNE6_PAXIN|nr:hypothetical protein PAXINDRAFT_173248 [Paxillus involutus ATCC 200175]